MSLGVRAWAIVPVENGEGFRSGGREGQRKRTSPVPPVGIPLSAREYEIGLLVIEGGSNFEISRQLGVSVLTVKKHMENILRKLKARNRIVAAIWLYQAAERIKEPVS